MPDRVRHDEMLDACVVVYKLLDTAVRTCLSFLRAVPCGSHRPNAAGTRGDSTAGERGR